MTSYRSSARACPQCGAFMKEREARGVTVDVCPECSGLWIDWFDGDLATVASDTGRLPPAGHTTEPGPGTCPDCRIALGASRYREDGPAVLRCGECAGAFVSRDALDLLVAVGPSVQEATPERGSVWSQLVERLRSWLGG